MFNKFFSICLYATVAAALSPPQEFRTERFRIGTEYSRSLPMRGGSDRYRHINNYEPFFVTISTEATKNFVIAYLDVTATVDEGGEIDFRLVKGRTGSQTMVFQLVSNQSDFLSFSFLAYGIREENYRQIANIITVPLPSSGWKTPNNSYFILFFILGYVLNYKYNF